MSDRVLDRMDEVLGDPGCDPHGDPIPRADGSFERRSAARLSEIDPGDEGPVVRISDHEPAVLCYLEERHVTIGTLLHVTATNSAAGSVSVARSDKSGAANVVEIARGAADSIWIAIDRS